MSEELILKLNSPSLRVGYRYILLDMLGAVSELNDLYIESLQATLAKEDLLPMVRPELRHNPALCPHLVCIGKPNQDLNQDLLISSLWLAKEDFLVTKPYVCGWIASELEIEPLAQAFIATGERLAMLLSMPFIPFYEPFRLQVLQTSAFDNQWLSGLFDGCLAYFYLDQDQSIREIQCYQHQHQHTASTPLFFSQTISFFQREIRSLFQLSLMWHDINQQQNIDIEPGALVGLLDYYQKAHQLHLTNQQDKIIFVLFSMQYGDLMRSDRLKNIINQVANGMTGQLSEQFQLVDDEFSRLQQNGLQ